MGMANSNTHTGINNGELAEFVVGLAAVARQENMQLDAVLSALRVDSNGRITGTPGSVNFYGDGKMNAAYRELEHYLHASPTIPNVDEVVRQCETLVQEFLPPNFDVVRCKGGSGGKDDVIFDLDYQRVDTWSIKYGVGAVERSQSPHWCSVDRFYGRLVDIGWCFEVYQDAYTEFIKPARRHSSRPGDWTPELRAQARRMLDAVRRVERYVAERFADGSIDPERVARGYLDSCLGPTLDDILIVNVVTACARRYYRHDAETLADGIGERKPSP